jgi:guanyl-specific ribonuclease Sa
VIARRRITVALVGLLVLVVAGWFGRGWFGGSPQQFVDRPALECPASSPRDGLAVHVPAYLPGADSGLLVCPLSVLPPEVGRTRDAIDKGGPFPYGQDGAVFGNREGRLPRKDGGYYHEYTVVTPGSRDRGARRLITGAARELYYTADHYLSYVVVDPGR